MSPPSTSPRRVRALGVDLGTKRIGLAVSDLSGTLASPLEVLQRSKSRAHDHRELARIARREEAEVIVVGLPLSLSGEATRAARSALAEVERLASVVDVPVETHDERLTTVTAERQLREAGVDAARRRATIDAAAAAVILQSWLDARREAAEVT